MQKLTLIFDFIIKLSGVVLPFINFKKRKKWQTKEPTETPQE